MLQLLCWWICHVSILFWRIAFPIQARSLNQSKRTRYTVHATCVLVSLLVPLLPVLVTIGYDLVTNGEEGVGTVGFTITRFPPLLCTSIASEPTFYSLVLPSIIILDVGLALLILLFWFVHKVRSTQSTSYRRMHAHTALQHIMDAHTHAQAHVYDTHTRMHARTHARTHAHTHTHTHTHTHGHAHTHTHTHSKLYLSAFRIH